ncbi:hypothetical protein EDC94DRAFT_582951 [Helicostylum pulchrum]|uniref:Uncharacterized protein n=1 Tax=Helicostylum pulchrum TaxID=562976 RepID=A0ABP9YHF0_9FUNG|nr:hypothetical protein EDC94DRAFT_582951 [Helicostylum pulchrum]
MENLKRKFPSTCPDCSSEVELHQINFDSAVEICNNLTCAFPFDRSCAGGLIHEFPCAEQRYGKKIKTQTSSIANTVAVRTASDNDEHSVKSAKETNSDIPESSSLIKQKEQLNCKDLTLPTGQGNQDMISAFIKDGQQEQALTGGQTTAKGEMINPNDCDPIITALLNFYSYITLVPAKSTEVQLPVNIALPPVTAARKSSTTQTAPSMSLEAIESLLNDTDNIIPAYDSVDCSSPSSITTPKDPSALSWFEDLDALFGADMAQSKFNPLQVDNDFDSFLGI